MSLFLLKTLIVTFEKKLIKKSVEVKFHAVAKHKRYQKVSSPPDVPNLNVFSKI